MTQILSGILWGLLYLFCFILALVIILLVIRYQVYFFKDDKEMKLKFKVSFIKVYEIPPKNPKRQKENPDIQKKENGKIDSEKEKSNAKKEKIKRIFFDKKENDIKINVGNTQMSAKAISENFSCISEDLKDIFNIIFDVIKHFGKYISFKFLNIQIVVSCDDVADTGKTYGYLCSVFYPAIDFISEKIKIKKHFYDLGYNFNETSPYYKIEGQARLRGFHILILAFKALGIFPKVDNIKENIN